MIEKGEVPITEGMSYVEKLDFAEQAHRHELEKQKTADTAELARVKSNNRAKNFENACITAAVICVLAVVAWLIWIIYQGSTKPPAPDPKQQTCVSAGGSYVSRNCIMPRGTP